MAKIFFEMGEYIKYGFFLIFGCRSGDSIGENVDVT